MIQTVSSEVTSRERVYRLGRRILQGAQKVMERLSVVLDRANYFWALKLAHRPQPTDIYIVSFPKSGTTVMQMMLHQIVSDGSVDFRHIDEVVPWFDLHLVFGAPLPDAVPGRPRVFKTHRTLDQLPNNAKYIYLFRNPKDSCVSTFYHSYAVMTRHNTSFETFVPQFVEPPGTLWGTWFDHFLSCATRRPKGPVLEISYEDIVMHLPDVVDRVSKFCGYALNAEERARVIERSGFQFMKRNNAKFDPRLAWGPPMQAEFIRKGINGDWANELTPALAATIDAHFEKTMRRLPEAAALTWRSRITSPGATVRGTITSELPSAREVWDDGLKLPLNDEPVAVGDKLRLKLRLNQASYVVIDEAEVVSLETGGGATVGTLRFKSGLLANHLPSETPCVPATAIASRPGDLGTESERAVDRT